MIADLSDSKRRVVGSKQILRRLNADELEVLFVACDAQEHVRRLLLDAARDKGVKLVETQSMAQLGKACGIAVGSAAAGILREKKESSD